jgi:hypothetical protein
MDLGEKIYISYMMYRDNDFILSGSQENVERIVRKYQASKKSFDKQFKWTMTKRTMTIKEELVEIKQNVYTSRT